MRILVHDYGGHAFPVQLSRYIASKGHEVFHFYAGFNVTPRGEIQKKKSDPKLFNIEPIFIREPLQKYSFFKRWRQEIEYGKLLARVISDVHPDVVISANTPIDTQRIALKSSLRLEIPYVIWLQDITSIAAKILLQKRLWLFGSLIGQYYLFLEKVLLQKCDHIISISDDFLPILRNWGINEKRISVIPNWAPVELLPVRQKQNPWAIAKDLDKKFCFLYSGTLGMKHNPQLLMDLAKCNQEDKNTRVVVISEGLGAKWLENKKETHSLQNLLLYGFQPFSDLADVMGTADVLLVLLEQEAGIFSVPSKVLSYLCAARPILAAIPENNLSAHIISDNHAGIVVSPSDSNRFIEASNKLFQEPGSRKKMGGNARKYAEDHFVIEDICNKFLKIITQILN